MKERVKRQRGWRTWRWKRGEDNREEREKKVDVTVTGRLAWEANG